MIAAGSSFEKILILLREVDAVGEKRGNIIKEVQIDED